MEQDRLTSINFLKNMWKNIVLVYVYMYTYICVRLWNNQLKVIDIKNEIVEEIQKKRKCTWQKMINELEA